MEQLPMETLKVKLQNRYKALGFSPILFSNDWGLIRRLGVHPQLATLDDIQAVILRANTQATKANYNSRLRSIFKALNKMQLIDNNPTLDMPAVRKGRGVPRPLTKGEAELIMTEAREPMRSWFVIGCLAGLRAMEVSRLRGLDLELTETGYILRVYGKGGTDLAVPVTKKVSDLILSFNTKGRVFQVTPNKLSARAGKEMRRLGIEKKTFHSCRHYFATTMLEKSNGDLLAVRDLMRHSSVATTQVYTQLMVGKTRSLVDLL